MVIYQCDICRTTLEDTHTVSAGFGKVFAKYFTFCPPFGAPVMEFLKKRGLIEPEVLAYLERKEITKA
jgi:hypothetical protein